MVPAPTREEVNDDDQGTSDQAPTELRRSTRTRSTLEWYGNPVLEIMLLDNGEPTNYEEAMAGPDFDKWLKAMKTEIGSMYENELWFGKKHKLSFLKVWDAMLMSRNFNLKSSNPSRNNASS